MQPRGESVHYARTIKKRRYSLVLTSRIAPWAASSSEALKHVFGEDDIGAQALAFFQSAFQPGTLKNYGSNMAGFSRVLRALLHFPP